MLVSLRIKVKGGRVRHIAPSLVRYDRDIIAYLVLIRIAFERIKGIAHRDVRGPGNASVGAKGIKQLRIGVVRGISRVMPHSIEPTIWRDRECSEPMPLAGVNRVVVDLHRRAKG